MKKYRPKSWSEQAREMADNQIYQVLEKECSIAYSLRFFSNSYRAPIIRHRAAKRFGRVMKKYGINIYDYEIRTEFEKSLNALEKRLDNLINE